MRKRALGLAVALIVGAFVVSASGAATTNAQNVTKVDVSTRADVVHYLRSIHVNPKGAVIQRGLRNYAGAHCPGKGWTCAKTKHTVVQIAKKAGHNRFACTSSKCAVVQFSGVKGGVYTSGRILAAKNPPNNGTQTATCLKTSGLNQSCSITQTSATQNNLAVVYENEPKSSGLTQTGTATASITQQATGATTGNTACVTQNISIDGSTVAKNGTPVTVTLQAHQSVTIKQDATGSGGNNAANGATSSGSCDTTTLGQNQTLSSTANGGGPITQNEDNVYSPCGDGITGEYANLCLDIEQNQGIANGAAHSGPNNATFTQTSTQTAIANTPAGPVAQTQSTPLCGDPSAPAHCVFPGGLVGTINQDSSVGSSSTATQVETQCEDANASKTALSTCRHDSGDQDFDGSYKLTQNQYGPVGVGKVAYHGNRRVPARTGKGLGASIQTGGNGNNSFMVRQTSTQDNDEAPGGTQLNSSQADCNTTGGSCTANQTTSVNGGGTQDGYTSPAISGLIINCPKNQPCVGTPPPDPSFVSGPSNPNPSASAAFNFTDPATGGVHFLCKIDGTPQTCSSGVAFFQGYGPHTFQVAASDNHGNVSAYVPATAVSWTNVPPDPTITPSSKPANPEPFGNTDTFKFTDAESPVHFQCTLDGNMTPCNTGSKSYTDLPSGQHTFSVRAFDTTDTYGSINSASYTWVITPPDPSITTASEPGNPDFAGNSYTFAFTDADSTVHYQCQIDSQTPTACNSGTSPTYSGLAPGSHTFSVTAYDQSDTYPSNHPATFTWSILPLEVSALGTDGSSAGWACQPGGPIGLTLGTDTPDTYAVITLDDVAGLAISTLPEPTFTTDNYAAGSPRYYITLDNGDSLWGYPANSGLNGTDFAWAINNGNTYDSWADVQSAESGTTVTGAYVIADGDQSAGTTDKISDLTFNGTDFNSGTCTPAP